MIYYPVFIYYIRECSFPFDALFAKQILKQRGTIKSLHCFEKPTIRIFISIKTKLIMHFKKQQHKGGVHTQTK